MNDMDANKINDFLVKSNWFSSFILREVKSANQYYKIIEFPMHLSYDQMDNLDTFMVSLGFKSLTIPNKNVYVKKSKSYSFSSV